MSYKLLTRSAQTKRVIFSRRLSSQVKAVMRLSRAQNQKLLQNQRVSQSSTRITVPGAHGDGAGRPRHGGAPEAADHLGPPGEVDPG